jgi:hypothetical protein
LDTLLDQLCCATGLSIVAETVAVVLQVSLEPLPIRSMPVPLAFQFVEHSACYHFTQYCCNFAKLSKSKLDTKISQIIITRYKREIALKW